MRKHLEGLDHVVVRVADLDRAAEDFRQLGFKLTPRGRHSTGTENHCAMFGFDYLELLGVPPGVSPPFYGDFPLEGDGMTALALKSTDAASVERAWARADLHPEPVMELARPVDPLAPPSEPSRLEPHSADTGRPTARFRLVPLPAERTPGGRAFACEHLTPELVWRPGTRQHPNQVTGINKVVIAADDPGAAGVLWGRIFDVAPHPIPGGVSITTGAAPIVILTPAAIAAQLPRVPVAVVGSPAHYAVVYLTTRDLAAAAAVVRASGLPAVALPDASIAVTPAGAHGIVLVFR